MISSKYRTNPSYASSAEVGAVNISTHSVIEDYMKEGV